MSSKRVPVYLNEFELRSILGWKFAAGNNNGFIRLDHGQNKLEQHLKEELERNFGEENESEEKE